MKKVILFRSCGDLSRKALPADFARRVAARSAERDAEKPVPPRLARASATLQLGSDAGT